MLKSLEKLKVQVKSSREVEQQLAEERAARKPTKGYVKSDAHKRRIAELLKRSVAR